MGSCSTSSPKETKSFSDVILNSSARQSVKAINTMKTRRDSKNGGECQNERCIMAERESGAMDG